MLKNYLTLFLASIFNICHVIAQSTPFLENGGEVTLEAESFDSNTPRISREWTSFSDANASGGVAMEVLGSPASTGLETIGPEMTYQINFTTPGIYKIWVRTASTNGDPANNSIHVGLDGNCLTCQPGDNGIGKNRADFTWSNTVGGANKRDLTVEITQAGLHTLNIWMREDGVQIDKIYFTQSNTEPTDLGPNESAKTDCPSALDIISLLEIDEDRDFVLYPNPVSEQLNYSLPKTSEIDRVLIIDRFGKTYKITNKSSQQLDISSFEPGLYQIRIIAGGQVFIKSFLKK